VDASKVIGRINVSVVEVSTVRKNLADLRLGIDGWPISILQSNTTQISELRKQIGNQLWQKTLPTAQWPVYKKDFYVVNEKNEEVDMDLVTFGRKATKNLFIVAKPDSELLWGKSGEFQVLAFSLRDLDLSLVNIAKTNTTQKAVNDAVQWALRTTFMYYGNKEAADSIRIGIDYEVTINSVASGTIYLTITAKNSSYLRLSNLNWIQLR